MVVVNEGMFPIFPVYVSDTEPKDKSSGKIWYKSSTKQTYIADGTIYNELISDNDFVIKATQQNMLNIKRNSIASGSNLNDYDEALVDIFTDSDGIDNTIDTGNTDARFNTDRYENKKSSTKQNLTSGDYYHTTATVIKTFNNINGLVEQVTNILGGSWHNATGYCYMRFYYDDATDDVSSTQSETDYNGISKTYVNPNPNKTVTQIEVYVWTSNGSNRVLERNTSFDYNYNDDCIVQTNALSIIADPVGVQIFCTNATTGNGSVDFDFKIGSNNWQTGNALNEKIVNSDTGSTITLKLNLNGSGAGNTAEASDYVVFLYY